MINKAIREELISAIPELDGEIYPTNAPETAKRTYLVYVRKNKERLKTLDGYIQNKTLRYMFNVMATSFNDMAEMRNKVENVILSFPRRNIGEEGIYVQDVDIENIDEVFEHNLNVNRGIIEFTVYL